MRFNVIYLTIFLLFIASRAQSQFTENLIYPDFEVISADGKVQSSSDWQFANLYLRISSTNSAFIISINEQQEDDFKQMKLYKLTQTRPWASKDDKVNMCFAKAEDGKEYVVRMTMDEANGDNFFRIAEMRDGEETGWSLTMSKSKKYHDENIMFIGSDGLSAYMYNFLYHNTLTTYKQKLGVDDLSFYYTSHKTFLEAKEDEYVLTYPIEDYYSSLLTYIDISKFVSIKDGIYTFSSNINGNDLSTYVDSKDRDFGKMKYSWFIPENIEIISYESTAPGSWKESERGITFVGDGGSSDFAFEVVYRIKNTAAKKLEKTEVQLKESIKLDSRKVKVSIWDNNVEDGDIISLSLNGEWIIRNLRVSKCKATFFLDLKEGENFLVMKAENIGEKPPNTAAFYFQTDTFKKEIVLNSDLGKSDMVSIVVE